MKKVYSVPTVNNSRAIANNGISQCVLNLAKFLPEYGYELSDTKQGCDLALYHAGEGEESTDIPYVSVSHGLYPTSMRNAPAWWYEVNRRVIRSAIGAKRLIVPSEWVADMFRRDMKLNPTVVHWGVDLEQWQTQEQSEGYVLWNKNRPDEVCNPVFMNEAAARLPHLQFVSTFGKATNNVKIIGRQHHETMRSIVKKAGIYLATTKETGDIGTREALAAGVPVVGFKHGAITDIVQSGINGFLAETGDIDGLSYGLDYALRYRDILSANARYIARNYGWEHAAKRVAGVFNEVLSTDNEYKVSVIIPCHNYEKYISETIESVYSQNVDFHFEIIVVDDGSTDNSIDEIRRALTIAHSELGIRCLTIHQDNEGVANARNNGIYQAKGEYIVCLDSDDKIEPNFLQVCADALDNNPFLGIAFTRMKFVDGRTTDWLSRPIDYNAFANGFNQVPTCCMFRRDDFLRMEGFRQYMHPSEDADMWLRLLTFTGKRAECVSQEPLFVYRLHDDSASAKYRGTGLVDPFTLRAKEGLPTWVHDNRPFAAPPLDPKKVSGNVYAYDKPIIKVVIHGGKNRQITLDALENQSYRFWTLDKDAPLAINIKSGDWLSHDYFENLLRELKYDTLSEYNESEFNELMCCGNNNVNVVVVDTMSSDDFVYVEYLSDASGPVMQFGKATGQNYGYRVGHEVFLMHKADVEANPQHYKVLPSEAVTVEVQSQTVIPSAPTLLDTPDAMSKGKSPMLTEYDLGSTDSVVDPTLSSGETYALKEAAVILDLGESTLRKKIKENDVKPVDTSGNAYLYDINELKRIVSG